MANMLIGWSDWGDEATITSQSAQTSGFPATQLQATQPTDYWEATGSESHFVVLDRGESATWNAVALLFTNAPTDSTWRIRGASTEAALTDGSALHDSGVLPFRVPGDDDTWDRHHGLHFVSAGVTCRWLRVDVYLGATLALDFVADEYSYAGPDADGTLEAGRLVVGDLFQPAVNDAYGRTVGVADPSTVERSEGSALFSDARDPYLTASLNLQFFDDAEAFGEALTILRRRGRRRDVLWVGDPEAPAYLMQQLIYGRLGTIRPIALPNFGRYDLRVTIEEGL